MYPLIEAIELLSFMFKEMEFDSIKDNSLNEIWLESPVLNRFRGIDWHKEPCRSCRIREDCRGGSRLNAYVITKDIHEADPFCVLSPSHKDLLAVYDRKVQT